MLASISVVVFLVLAFVALAAAYKAPDEASAVAQRQARWPERRVVVCLVTAGLILAGLSGCRNNMPHAWTWPTGGDIQYTVKEFNIGGIDATMSGFTDTLPAGFYYGDSPVYYDPAAVPQKDKYYMPVQCQQCRQSPCTKVCPVQATWQEKDGLVVVDYNWCIGCRYCMAACPYGARHFNWAEPSIPKPELNPATHYLGNRPRPKGVVEKCTFCIQRVRAGRYPACVEVCPVGARKFGNLLDPDSEIRYIIENKRVYILKEELNTQPKFFYYYGL